MAEPSTLIEFALVLERTQCVACAICADVCPCQALTMGWQDLFPTWAAQLCNGCQICERQCPTGAIRVRQSARNA